MRTGDRKCYHLFVLVVHRSGILKQNVEYTVLVKKNDTTAAVSRGNTQNLIIKSNNTHHDNRYPTHERCNTKRTDVLYIDSTAELICRRAKPSGS